MYYVYVLYNIKRDNYYIGYSSNLRQRIKYHKQKDSNWVLVYYEAYASKNDAFAREKKLKNYGSSWAHLKRRIKESVSLGKGGGSSEPKPR